MFRRYRLALCVQTEGQTDKIMTQHGFKPAVPALRQYNILILIRKVSTYFVTTIHTIFRHFTPACCVSEKSQFEIQPTTDYHNRGFSWGSSALHADAWLVP